MSLTDSNKQPVSGNRRCFDPRTQNQSWGDANNVIPFPDRRASSPQAKNTEPRTIGLLFRQTLRVARGAVLRLSGTTNPVSVQRDGGCTGTGAANEPDYPRETTRDDEGRLLRMRNSA